MNARYKGGRAFTLIELLIVVAIIGLIASILIPNLIDALQKAKQKRTVAEMRDVGTAWMSWLTDQSGAASAAANYDATNHDPLPYDSLVGYLVPAEHFFYTNSVADKDGWGFDLQFCIHPDLSNSTVMMICSPGRNGTFGDNPTGAGSCCGEIWEAGAFVGTDYDQDLVWADGQLIRFPGNVN